jgi:hypothetical protein
MKLMTWYRWEICDLPRHQKRNELRFPSRDAKRGLFPNAQVRTIPLNLRVLNALCDMHSHWNRESFVKTMQIFHWNYWFVWISLGGQCSHFVLLLYPTYVVRRNTKLLHIKLSARIRIFLFILFQLFLRWLRFKQPALLFNYLATIEIMRVRTRLNWLKIGCSSGLFWTQQCIFVFI